MIELQQVSKLFGDTKAVDCVDLKIEKGEVCVLIGPSGCGKSTTLKMMNRMIDRYEGTILIDGRENKTRKPELLRRTIGYVIQSVGLFPHMNVCDNISVVPRLLKWDKERIEQRGLELMDLIGLDSAQYGHKYPHELSGGEAQRIGVARALAADPPILLMDEPFGAVDPLGRLLLQNEFLAIQKRLKKTVVFVTHDLDEAIRLADRIAIMNDGKIVQYDIPETILSSPVNSFVRDFVGSDRSLKKLARYDAARAMKEPEAVILDDESSNERLAVLAQRGLRFVWAIGADRRLKGWIDLRHPFISSAPLSGFTEISVPEVAVGPEVSLKSVLSRMLGQGIKSIPVIDRDEKLIGEITLRDIERVSES
jgi:osmoprotectant transport system ATP-binding protein